MTDRQVDRDRTPAAGRPTVALFVTCMVDTLYPGVGLAAVELLERHGARVIFPEDQTCCGQPPFNAGYRSEARTLARRWLEVFWPLVRDGDVAGIVAPSGSCVAMVRRQFGILLADGDPEERRAVEECSAAMYELTEYLVDVLGVEDAGIRRSGRLAFHPCCHLLRELEVDTQPRRLLASIEGCEIVALEGADECCGFGGLFALKNAEISAAMGKRKARNLEASGADLVTLNDVSCMTQINGILRREGARCRALHIAELLAGCDSEEEGTGPGTLRSATRDHDRDEGPG